LLVFTIDKSLPFLANQVQPEPKLAAALVLNYVMNLSTPPHLATMASFRAPVGSTGLGVRQCQ
jgi:hypothetical protein